MSRLGEPINAAAMERAKRAVTIELTADDTLWVTLNGEHTRDDMERLHEAVKLMAERSTVARAVLGDR